ncbi:hypothetical protein AVEN_44624-1 [Araneus ventricosus]|uniref:DUF7041 domain-containing protein n=1 Tax=Araneus ventricosus TaxID=182803 RepID=A0A4Y2K5K6_ARAVE|nr:hypothetical protein AVEN_246534-1 [Araneus ventricosus]GBM98013.1 hypothetical protein AVEN_44624-1 [Araneus ventricosus]
MPETKLEVSPSVEQDSQLSRIALKAPVFWEHDPELWFFQVESQFVIAGISNDSTKFHAVVAVLNSNVLSCVRDIVRNPPLENAYIALKDRVLQHFAQSSSARLNLLLKDLQLGDKRHSHLLSEMRNLAPAKMEDDILQTLWLQRLPANLQQILSVCKASLDELAQIADKIHEVSGCNLTVARVESNSDQFELDAIKAELSDLKNMVKKLSVSQYSHGRIKPRRRSRTPSRHIADKNVEPKRLCWYHHRFGDKASKCVKPCAYSLN